MGVKHLRLAAGLTIADVLSRIEEKTGQTYTKGAISAVENGKRGASAELLTALEEVYGLPARSITTDYTPSPARRSTVPA
ncbi:helix-turn-helix domain-containing protein [Gordonia sp. SND2]|uniref:helix-turn-helix domain-containing protein n=1 Tax=Gordonia sp. SND2 TaxID=3388659 RepID=UPI00398AAE17